MLIHTVKRAVLGNQLQRGLLTDAGNTGDVIGAIPHQGLDIHKLCGCHAVFFKKVFTCKIYGFSIGQEQHVYAGGNQLQCIAVTR